jgi:hypothetical protein
MAYLFEDDKSKVNLSEALTGDAEARAALIDALYPVGAVYATGSNVNPAGTLGGTWELIHKRFRRRTVSNCGAWNNTNTKYLDGSPRFADAIIDGEKVQIRLVWFNKVRYADESLPIITLDLSMLGLSGIYQQFAIAQAPNLDSVLPLSIANNGIITLTDTIYKGSAPTALNSQCSVTFDLQFAPSSMLDSACDEFVWKRTA